MTRRLVRVSETVFELLESSLGTERGPNDEPSAHDFAYLELISITVDPWPDLRHE